MVFIKNQSCFFRWYYSFCSSAITAGSIFSPPLHTPHPHFTLVLRHTRFASFGAHRGVAACFIARRSLNPHPWLLLPPYKPQYGIHLRSYIFWKGAIATECSARLLVARASRGVTLFVKTLPLRSCSVHFAHYVDCCPHSSFSNLLFRYIHTAPLYQGQKSGSARLHVPFSLITLLALIPNHYNFHQPSLRIATKFALHFVSTRTFQSPNVPFAQFHLCYSLHQAFASAPTHKQKDAPPQLITVAVRRTRKLMLSSATTLAPLAAARA